MTRPTDDDRAVRYLLGELPEAERDTLEEEYFSQEESFAELKAAEDDLIDAYSRGTLPPERKAAFEARWLQTESGRQRVLFAQALKTATGRSRDGGWVGVETRGGRPRWGAWAAGLAALAAGAGLMIRVAQLQGELGRVRAESEAARQSAVEQERRAQEQGSRLAHLARELERLRSQAAGLEELLGAGDVTRVASLFLTAGLRRDFEPVPRLVLEPDTTLARLTLVLKEDAYPSYRISIQTVEGRDLWVRDGLRATKTDRGPALVLALPATALGSGHHVAMVRGSRQPASDTHAEYVFQVVSQR